MAPTRNGAGTVELDWLESAQQRTFDGKVTNEEDWPNPVTQAHGEVRHDEVPKNVD
jgi:hypothetical protein